MRIVPSKAILISLLLVGCGNKEIVLSTRASPNGSMVAENILVDHSDPNGTSHLRIRSAHTREGYDKELSEPAPDMFMRWINEDHLEVWRERTLCDPRIPEMMGPVHIVCRSYASPYNSLDIYHRLGVSAEMIVVPPTNVSVVFDQRPTDTGRSCVLSIETGQDQAYDVAKVEITVTVSQSCKREKPCAGMSTRFQLNDRDNTVPQRMLTSATITDIPSYNRTPTGRDGTTIRGQFLENNAVAVIDQLKMASIQIDYSRDFFDQVLIYDVPLTGHARTLGEFDACVGNADLLWTQHGSHKG